MSNYISLRQDRFDRNFNKASDLLDAGFATKAAQKNANGYLNTAYSDVREIITQQVRCTYAPGPEHTDAQWQAYVDRLNEYDLPFDLHQVRDRHLDKAAEIDGIAADKIRLLVETRAQVKAEPIQPPQPKAEKSEYQVKAERSIVEEMERMKTQYLRAVDLGRIFNGIPVTASSHWVVNQYGTGFPRTFYYLDGKLTRLNILIAAAEQVAREKREA